MAEKEAFCLDHVDIALSAAFNEKDEITDIEDTECILKTFKDVLLVTKQINEDYFHLSEAVYAKDEVILKCHVHSEPELNALKGAVDDDSLARKLTDYASRCGVEIELGLGPERRGVQLQLFLSINSKHLKKVQQSVKKRKNTDHADSTQNLHHDKQKRKATEQACLGDNEKTTEAKKSTRSSEKEKEKVKKETDASSECKRRKGEKETDQFSSKEERNPDSLRKEEHGKGMKSQTDQSSMHPEETQPSEDRTRVSTNPVENKNVECSVVDIERFGDTSVQKPSEGKPDKMSSSEIQTITSNMRPQDVYKEVIINISSTVVKHSDIIKVEMEFSNGSYSLLKIPMYHIADELWTTRQLIFSGEEDIVSCKILITFLGRFWSEKLISGHWTPISSNNVCRLMHGIYETEKGHRNHVFDILVNIEDTSCSLKEAIMQMDQLFNQRMDIDNILSRLRKMIETNCYSCKVPSSFAFLGYVYGKLYEWCDLKSKHITQGICKAICQSLNSISEGDLPSKSMAVYERVIPTLCQIAFPDSSWQLLTIIEHCYPFVSIAFLGRQLDKSIQYDRIHEKDTPVIYVRNVLSILSKCKDPSSLNELMSRLARHLSLKLVIEAKDVMCPVVTKETFDEILDSKLQIECRNAERSRDLQRLKNIHDMIVLTEENYIGLIKSTVLSVVGSILKSSKIDLSILKNLLTSTPMNNDQSFCLSVMNILSIGQHQQLHYLFIELLDIQFLEVDVEELSKLVIQWFKTAIRYHCSDVRYAQPIDDLPHVYSYLNKALSVISVTENRDIVKGLKEEAFTFMKRVNANYLLHEMFQNDEYCDGIGCLDTFQEHLQVYLSYEKNRDAVLSLIAGTGTSSWSSWTTSNRGARICQDIISKSLELTDLQKMENEESVLLYMLKFEDFWKNLMYLAKSNPSVKDNGTVLTARCTLQCMSEKIMKGDITLSFLRELELRKKTDDDVVSLVLTCSERSKKDLKRALADFRKIDETAIKHLKVLRLLLKKLKKEVGPCVEDLDTALERFDQQKQEMKDGSTVLVSAVVDGSFWDPFTDIISPMEKISVVIESEIFWNICRLHIKELASKCQISDVSMLQENPEEHIHLLYDEETYNSAPLFVTLKVITILSEEGIKMYDESWRPLLKGISDESGTIGDLKSILTAKSLDDEIRIAESFFRSRLPSSVKETFHMYRDYFKYTEKLKIILDVLKILKLHHIAEGFAESIKSFTDLTSGCVDELHLRHVFESGKLVKGVHSLIDDELADILKELSRSSNLVSFLCETALEDLRNLIDAVEEHSEQSVQASTVSALIEVKRFLSPVIRSESSKNVEQVLIALRKSRDENKIKDLDKKISECNTSLHGLKALFHNVANRGEVTKQIVQNAVHQGTRFSFQIDQRKICTISLTYKKHGKTQTHSDSDIKDLRSRVLLMVNADAQEVSPKKKHEKMREDFENFILFADLSMQISALLSQLCQSGHPEVNVGFKITIVTQDLKMNVSLLDEKLETWLSALSKARKEYMWLNYFYPEQLCKIAEYFKSPNDLKKTETSSLLSFTGHIGVDLSKGKQGYCEHILTTKDDVFGLCALGKTLDVLFKDKTVPKTEFPTEKGESRNTKFSDVVQGGQLFIAGLNEKSDLVIPTIMALYRNTTRCLPLPHQVYFCQEDTTWEDIELVLHRCLGSVEPQLFTLACVENLTSSVQFKVVDVLQSLEGGNFLLAVICRGGVHDPFLDHFSERVHNVQPMTETAMEFCLQTVFPSVETVMSDVPGQGKTEYINEVAWSKGLRKKVLHISGEFTAKELVTKLSAFDKTAQLLHIDVGTLSKLKDADHLLFQLVVLGVVTHGSNYGKLNTRTICIEVANTIGNVLRNTLHTVMRFKRTVLNWNNYNNFCSSSEVCSSVQVVCHYLDEYDRGTLDTKDIYFTGEKACKPLLQPKCQALLRKHFSVVADMSFSIVHTFLNVLSDQLKKFACSYFFRTQNISEMLGGDAGLKNVKSKTFEALLNVSREFATRSVNACREEQSSSVKSMSAADLGQSLDNLATNTASAQAVTKRVEGMIQWAESNHLILAFHNQDIQTLSALYRNKTMVPKHIQSLFETQVKTSLPDFDKLSQNDLQEMLQRIARFKPGAISADILKQISVSYALTPDNLLKMILIILRTRCHVPVVIMGETGCGKTSLIRYLSCVCGIDLEVQNIHAGISEMEIVKAVMAANEKALDRLDDTIWLFLDEINTCNHLGLINTILCHHKCQNTVLSPNLVVMAACNPYKLRSEKSVFTAGLQSKVQTDEKSRLVYRVNPLPESMVDYIWDYGSLNATDEKAYIKRMVGSSVQDKLVSCVVSLLVESQKFIRDKETGSCVSLRDVNRCRKLIDWFKETIKTKMELGNKSYLDKKIIEIRAVILALAHSYHSRLPDTQSRREYRDKLAKVFADHQIQEDEQSILKIIHEEQSDIINRMELPHGTAKNTALKENVFVVLVCILNRIPVFVVGKPGCSKSLSLQLIKSNLRGLDSKDPYFKTLPQVFCVSYQGSESSTSDGIIKVFQKAEDYKKQDKDESILPVVILDEIGLAETSRFNPLKVLHSLLEPSCEELPNVAVVGISNWALDAAKMNRAIHLSRPDMDVEELYHTGLSISEASAVQPERCMNLSSANQELEVTRKLDEQLVRAIAEAYVQYIAKQKFKNFHGLRDFYSLVKYVSKECSSLSESQAEDQDEQLKIVQKGLLRNFGGLSSEIDSVLTVFSQHLQTIQSCVDPLLQKDDLPSILDLLRDNINDKQARHLLLSTRGESALSIIEGLLTETDRNYVTIVGSQFEEDLTDDYNYRILSRIILCMEEGVVLILKDLETIYGSLYDMLNQNYTVVGSKNNCRIALGAYSNPLCHVHENFRCIVLVEEESLDLSDPPFLNRFEKQYIRLSDMLSTDQRTVVHCLETWIDACVHIEGFSFSRTDMIPVDSPDMVSSLVSLVYQKCQKADSALVKCKDALLKMCTPEAVVRFERSQLDEFDNLQEKYFNLPLHKGLGFFLKKRLEETTSNLKEMLFTHSNIHTNVTECMDLGECQVEKLGAIKSEKHLYQRINSFWNESEAVWLIIQCTPGKDNHNLLLMKSIVDKEEREFAAKGNHEKQKHALIILHVDRNENESSLGLVNFLGGWNMSFLDNLLKSECSLIEMFNKPKLQLIQERRPFTSFLSHHLFWAFTLLHYHDVPRDLRSLKNLLHCLTNNRRLMLVIEEKVWNTLEENADLQDHCNWQVDTACDRVKLYTHVTLLDALENEVNECIKHPLAAIVYRIEELSAWDSVTVWLPDDEDTSKQDVWIQHVQSETIMDIKSVPPPEGPECYDVLDDVLSLRSPFSKCFIERVEKLREPILDAVGDFETDEITVDLRNTMASRFQESIAQAGTEMFDIAFNEYQFQEYFKDVCNVLFSGTKLTMNEEDRVRVCEWSVKSRFCRTGGSLEENVCMLHITCWLYNSAIESELKLVDSCLHLTDANLDDIMQERPKAFKSEDSEVVDENSDGVSDKSRDESLADLQPLSPQGPNMSSVTPTIKDQDREDNSDDIHHTENASTSLVDLPQKHPNILTSTDDDQENKDNLDEVLDESDICLQVENQSTALVDFACQQLLPTEKLLKTMSIDEWINGVNVILSIASGLSYESKEFQSLRMCSDFLYLVLKPANLPKSTISEIGLALKKDSVESEKVFKIVVDLTNTLQEREVALESLQHFFSCYISSALAADTEGPLLEWTFDMLPSLSLYKKTFSYFGPTIYHTLLIETSSEDDDEDEFEETSVLKDLENCITTYKDADEPDSELVCLVVDVFQTHFCTKQFALDHDTMENVLRWDETFKTDNLTLKHLKDLASLKNFLEYFSQELNKREPVDTSVIQKINGIFNMEDTEMETEENLRSSSMQQFFMKVVSQNSGLRRVDELTNDFSSDLPFLTNFVIPENQRCQALELNPVELGFPDMYNKITEGYTALQTDASGSKLKTILQKSNGDFAYCLLGVALQQIYGIQTIRQLTDSERNDQVKVFYELVESTLATNQQSLLKKLCSIDDFHFQLLQANPLKSADDHHMTICILHLSTQIFAYNPSYGAVSQNAPIFLRCMQSPTGLKKMFIPGSGFKESSLHNSVTLSTVSNNRQYARFTCSCKSIKIIDVTEKKEVCQKCRDTLKQDGEIFHISTEGDTKDGQGYVFVDVGCLKSDFTTVRELSPPAFRLLQFVLHGCLATSIGQQFTNEKDLANILNLPKEVDVTSYINNHLHIHWSALKNLTEMGDAQLAKLVNFIIRDGSSFFAKDSVQYHTLAEQMTFERKFTEYVDQKMKIRFQIVQDQVKQYTSLHPSSTCAKFESVLAEIPENENRLGKLPRLLREHMNPSVPNMHREFILQGHAMDYPVMSLILEKANELSLIQNITPLLQWHKCVLRYGNMKLKRADCKTQTVQDFIHGSQSSSDPSELQSRFESFRKAWNSLRDNIEILRSHNPQLSAMERLHKQTHLENCLIMSKNSCLMQVLFALQSVQNTFLTDTAAIALGTKTLSVEFLRHSHKTAQIETVQLEHMRKKQIIPKPDLEATLKFSQINTKFGHGRQRSYDMYLIESKLVSTCLLCKPFIRVSPSFPMINFAGESLHKTDELFENVEAIVGHESVDKDLKNSILQLQEKSPTNMQTLLAYLQMTFSLLRRAPISGRDKRQFLSEFLETWQSLFPHRVKEVDRLCTKIRLSQILSVYGLAENLVADAIFEGIEEKYRIEMPKCCMAHLNELVCHSAVVFQEALLSALKKIVFRYLQSGNAQPDDPLAPFLMERSIWPHGIYDEAVSKSSNPNAGLLHCEHMVEHIHATVEFLAESVEDRKLKEEKKSTLFQPKQKATSRVQKRKKKGVNFR